MSICKVLFLLFRGLFVRRSDLILENLALRQQMTIQQRTIKRPKTPEQGSGILVLDFSDMA